VVDIVLAGLGGCQLRIRLCNAYQLDFRTVKRVLEKAADVAVNESHDADSQGRGALSHQ